MQLAPRVGQAQRQRRRRKRRRSRVHRRERTPSITQTPAGRNLMFCPGGPLGHDCESSLPPSLGLQGFLPHQRSTQGSLLRTAGMESSELLEEACMGANAPSASDSSVLASPAPSVHMWTVVLRSLWGQGPSEPPFLVGPTQVHHDPDHHLDGGINPGDRLSAPHDHPQDP